MLILVTGVIVAGVRVARSTAGEQPSATAVSGSDATADAPAAPAANAVATAPRPADRQAEQPGPSLSLLGQSDLGGAGFNGNVRALSGYAYVGSWGSGGLCPALGVRVVDLADPAAPRVVAIAARIRGTSAEDVVPVRVSTPSFMGDLLAVGIQRCGGGGAAQGGLALVDVTDPHDPRDLGFFPTGGGTRGVHELDVTVRDGRVLALLAVPYSESRGDGDLRIVDITDPRQPVQLSSWGAAAALGITEGTGCNHAVYDHSVRAGAGGTRAYLSYWDAGLIILDISDPAAPRFLGRAVDADAEGAIHSADELSSGLLLVTEEDDVFRSPRGVRLRVEANGETADLRGCEAAGDTELDETGAISGAVTYAGTLCGAAGGSLGGIAVVEEGGCGLAGKARRARDAGAAAVLLLERGGLRTPENDELRDAVVPVVAVAGEDAERLRALAQAGGAAVLLPAAKPWGGVQVWDVRNPANPAWRGRFRTADAERFPPPGPGYYTVHNPLALGRYALFSWYSDGVRLVDFADADHPREVASFVPPAVPDPLRFFPTDAQVWGVARIGDLVLASDINGGLYVLRVAGIEG